jgi:hypothetical protein
MFDEKALIKVIGKLMIQVEEERRLRAEAIQALTKLPHLSLYSIKIPTKEEIEKRILELS